MFKIGFGWDTANVQTGATYGVFLNDSYLYLNGQLLQQQHNHQGPAL